MITKQQKQELDHLREDALAYWGELADDATDALELGQVVHDRIDWCLQWDSQDFKRSADIERKYRDARFSAAALQVLEQGRES